MAGHSKWKNIQHRKGAQDAKRGKVFTKIAKELTVAAKTGGGGDPDKNAKLRLILSKAKAANMPKDNIDRAIKKGTGESGGDDFLEKMYEGYGPGGIAVLVDCLTDNVNRTVSGVRHAFSRSGGNLGTEGSVSYMFKNKGLIVLDKEKVTDFDALFELALESGAEDVSEEEGAVEITCEPGDFQTLVDKVTGSGLEPEVSEIAKIPDNYNDLEEDKIEKLQRLIDTLEDLDDVQNVFHNGNI